MGGCRSGQKVRVFAPDPKGKGRKQASGCVCPVGHAGLALTGTCRTACSHETSAVCGAVASVDRFPSRGPRPSASESLAGLLHPPGRQEEGREGPWGAVRPLRQPLPRGGSPLPGRAPHLPSPTPWDGRRRLSALCPQGTEASPQGPALGPWRHRRRYRGEARPQCFLTARAPPRPCKPGDTASPQLSNEQVVLPTCQSHRGDEIVP